MCTFCVICSECVCEGVKLLEKVGGKIELVGVKIGGVAPNVKHICVGGSYTLLNVCERCVSFLMRNITCCVTSCVCAC